MKPSTKWGFTAAAITLALPAPAAAQTWTGNVSSNWSVGGNWSSNPNPPVSSQSTQLTFGASIPTSLNNDFPGGMILNRITFTNAAPSYSIFGNALDFRSTGGGIGPQIAFNAPSTVSFSNLVTLTNNLLVTGSGTGTLSLNSAISGGGGLTMSGTGTLRLGSGSNSFTGGVTVNSGRLELTNGGALGIGQVVTVNGGELNIGSLSNSSLTAIDSLTLNTGGTFRVPSGSGDYFLNDLVMNGGTVNLTGTTAFDLHFVNAAAAITVNSGISTWTGGGTSRFVNDTASPLPITLVPGTQAASVNTSVRLANGASGQGFRINGDGRFILSGTGSTASLIVDGATANIQVADMASLGSGSFNLNDFATLTYNGPTASSNKAITLSGGGGVIAVPQSATNLTLSGVISQSSALQTLTIVPQSSSGAGTLTLTGANTYTSYTWIRPGTTVSIATFPNGGVAGPLGASTTPPGNLRLGTSSDDEPSVLRYTGPNATTNRGLTVEGTVLGGTIVTLNDLTLTGQVTGGGRFNKAGFGTLTLTNTNNNYTGGTFINEGTLVVGDHGAVIPPGSHVTANPDTTFDPGGFSNSGVPIGTLTLNDGALKNTGAASSYHMNRLVTTPAGGRVSITGWYDYHLTGPGAGIDVNGSDPWAGDDLGGFFNDNSDEIDFRVAPGVTLNNSIRLNNGSFNKGFRLTGGGTFEQVQRPHLADLTLGPIRYRVDNVVGHGLLTMGGLTFDGGTLEYTGLDATMTKAFALDFGGGTIHVANPAIKLTLNSPVTGAGRLTKSGPGVLTLNTTANPYFGGITVKSGRVDAGSDAQLGLAEVTVEPAGTLRYSGTTATSRTFHLNGGTVEAVAGVTLTLNGATVNGGFLRGAFALTGAAALNGATTFNGATLNQTGAASATNFTNGGTLDNAVDITLTWNGGTNTSSGNVTVNGAANVSDFSSNGRLTVAPGGALNNSGSDLVLGGGSTTFVGSAATPGGTINLGTRQLQLRGGLLVNNGTVTNGTTVVDFGGLAKGAGAFDAVTTVNGGRFSPGNSPGRANVGTFFMSPGGQYDFEINNATGAAGPTGASGLSGWDLTLVGNTLDLTATPGQPFTVNLLTLLNPSPPDVAGAMANFNSGQAYSWLAFDVNAGGQILNWDPARIQLNSTGVVNPLAGNFSVHRDALQVFIDYVPSAATLYWDTNGSAAGAGGATPAGNWDGLAANFNTDPAGGAGALTAATGSSHRVVFAAGADGGGSYAVTLTGIRPAGTVEIARGNVTFNGGTLAAAAFDVAAGATGTVNSAVAGGPVGSFIKSGPGTLTLNALNTYTGGTTVQAGTLRVKRLHQNNPLNITGGKLHVMDSSPMLPSHPSGDNAFVSRPSALTIANNGAALGSRTYSGQLDLGNNDLILDYSDPSASPLDDIQDMIRAGYNGGDWLGNGITSSTANANRNFAIGVADNANLAIPFGATRLFSGQVVDTTTILVKFTHRIDLDMDGVITTNDATIFNSRYSEGAPAYWSIGDLDYDRVFTTNDATLFNSFYSEALASVPEPATAGVLTIGAMGLLRRQRRGA